VIASVRWPPLFLLFAFAGRCFGMIVCILRVLLGLGSVLFALGMIILAVSFCGCAMGLCSGFVMFRRLVVCIFHFVFLMLADELRQFQMRPQ